MNCSFCTFSGRISEKEELLILKSLLQFTSCEFWNRINSWNWQLLNFYFFIASVCTLLWIGERVHHQSELDVKTILFFLSYRVFNWMQGLNWTSMIITRLERTNKPVCLYNSLISFELVHEPSGFLDNPNIQIPALLSYLLLTSQWFVKIAKRSVCSLIS